MPATWQQLLLQGSWAGIAFDFLATEDVISRVIDRRAFPYVDGASLDDRVRDALEVSVRAVFLADDYPDVLFNLQAAVARGGVQPLVHPVYGQIQAAVSRFSVKHDPDDGIDCATADIVFVEDAGSLVFVGGAGGAQQAQGAPAQANMVRTNALAVNVPSLAFGAYLGSLPTPPTGPLALSPAIAMSAAFACAAAADALEASVDFSATEILATANGALASVASVLAAIADYDSFEAFDLAQALEDTASSLEVYAELLLSLRPPIVEEQIVADVPLLTWVHGRYGDSARVDEILLLNSLSDPLVIPAGTTLRCYGV